MGFMLVLLVPVGLLLAWAVVFDLRRRRRQVSTHDISAAARRVRADGESHGGPAV
jgi:hypothetical protein